MSRLTARVDAAVKQLDHKAPDWKHLHKPILCVDFDGVISEYKAGWHGPSIINDQPVTGAFDFLRKALHNFTVMIFSTRCNFPEGIVAMREWFKNHGGSDFVDSLIFEPGKPSWYLHIDDRALTFMGSWHQFWTPDEIEHSFKPWYYFVPGWREAQSQSKQEVIVDVNSLAGNNFTAFLYTNGSSLGVSTCPHGNEWDYCPVCSH